MTYISYIEDLECYEKLFNLNNTDIYFWPKTFTYVCLKYPYINERILYFDYKKTFDAV